jgi:hypothetical protein
MGLKVRISKRQRFLLQQFSPDLLEQLVELEWLREQVRQTETLGPKRLLTQFKAHRQQKSTKARRIAR